MKGQGALDPPAAAAAAVRRLSSNRPLFAVSLSTAVSQLLLPTPATESAAGCLASPFPASSGPLQAEDEAFGSDILATDERLSEQVASTQKPVQRTPVTTNQEVIDTPPKHWLTAQFVAQVRAHFEATLAASSEDEGEAVDEGEEEEQTVGEGETIKYQRAVCTAALHWGLLLLLSAESVLLTEPTPQLASETVAESSPDQQSASCPSSDIRQPQSKTLNSNRHENAESADAVLREALFAFEIIVRVSPTTATRLLPKALEWLSWGLSGIGGHHVLHSGGVEVGNKQIHIFDAAMENADTGSCGALLEQRVQQIKKGSLSSLFTCPLPDYTASGRIRSPSEHLVRVRLLELLLRGPMVLLGCSRVLAACVMPVRAAKGICGGDGNNGMRGTAPMFSVEGEDARAAAQAEASIQRRLCAETVGQLLAAMEGLKAVVLPGSLTGELQRPSLTLQLKHRDIEGLSEVERMILAACLPPVLRWVPASSQPTSGGSQEGHRSACSEDRSAEQTLSWAFAGTHFLATESAPRKAALYILATIQGLLLSFALNIQSSSKCLDTFGVAAAATDESVVRQAQALLKDVCEFFSFQPTMSVASHPLELPRGTFIHAVTGLCARALTAKELPKAFQVNPNRADSRILLSAAAAASAVEVQMAERGGEKDLRCPLTGRLQLREGLPDEQLTEVLPGYMGSEHSAVNGGSERLFLSYLSDEGASRMAVHVTRILTALVKSVPLEDEERTLGFIIPPLLRVLDVPQARGSKYVGLLLAQMIDCTKERPMCNVVVMWTGRRFGAAEVRFLGWRCLNEVAISCPRGALNNYRTPIMQGRAVFQALTGGFPIYTEVDVCFDAYLEAFTTFACRTFADEYDPSFFDCQNFLIDMCHPALSSSETVRSAFLKRSRALLVFAGDSANLRLSDWMAACLDALDSISLETIREGLQTLKVLLSVGIDIEEFLPQILCHLATTALVAKEESVQECSEPCSRQLRLAVTVESVALQLLRSADNELLSTICTKLSSHFQEWYSDEPSLVNAITKWLSWFSSLLQDGHEEVNEKKATPTGLKVNL